MAIALDGNGHANGGGGITSLNASLTTSNSSDVIIAVITINDTTVSSISSANTATWNLRKRQSTGGAFYIEEWYSTAASTLSTETITASFSASSFVTIDVFGISGANTSSIYDSNAALPDGQTTSTCSITTSNANDFLIGCYRFTSTPPTEGTGWTKISGADYQLTEYKIVSATQSGTSVPIGNGNGNQNAGIGDAIMEASGGGGGKPWYYFAQEAIASRRRIFLPANDILIARAA